MSVDPMRWPDQDNRPKAVIQIVPNWFLIVVAVCVVIRTLWMLDH